MPNPEDPTQAECQYCFDWSVDGRPCRHCTGEVPTSHG